VTWRSLGNVLPAQLSDARTELHFAAQLVSAPGTSLLAPEADYSHTNLNWDSTLGVLAGRHVGRASLRAALVFSPGDGSYDQPYFYVTPWPYPSTDALPLLPAGVHWHTEGWTGAVLTAEQVISRPADRQRVLVLDALGSAITACRTLLRR
jgi:hypothetical protein